MHTQHHTPLQVYLAIGQALAPGGLAADATQLLAAGEADVAAIAPDGAPKSKAAASFKSRLGVGSRSRPGLSTSNSSSSLYSASADPSTPATRCVPFFPNHSLLSAPLPGPSTVPLFASAGCCSW